MVKINVIDYITITCNLINDTLLFTKPKQHVIEIIYGRGKFVGNFNMGSLSKFVGDFNMGTL
jgi:NAD kinase